MKAAVKSCSRIHAHSCRSGPRSSDGRAGRFCTGRSAPERAHLRHGRSAGDGDDVGDAQDEAVFPTTWGSVSERVRSDAAVLSLTCHDPHGAVRAQHRRPRERASEPERLRSDDTVSSPTSGSWVPDCDGGQVLQLLAPREAAALLSPLGHRGAGRTSTRRSMSTGPSGGWMAIRRRWSAGSRRRFLRRFESERRGALASLRGAAFAPLPLGAGVPASISVGLGPGPETRLSSSRTVPTSRLRSQQLFLARRGAKPFAGASFGLLMSVDDMIGRVFRTLRRLGEDAENPRDLHLRQRLPLDRAPHSVIRRPHPVRSASRTRPPSRFRSSFDGPGTSRPAAGTGRITGTVDIAPTVLDAAGVAPDPTKPPLDGRSLLSGERRTRIVLEYWRVTWVPTWASLRTRRYQYVEYYRHGRTVLPRVLRPPARPVAASQPPSRRSPCQRPRGRGALEAAPARSPVRRHNGPHRMSLSGCGDG